MFLGSFPFRPRPQRTGESLVGLGVGRHHATLLNHEYSQFQPVLRIRDPWIHVFDPWIRDWWIRGSMPDPWLVWIRIRESMPLTNGSGFGSGSCYFRHWQTRRQPLTSGSGSGSRRPKTHGSGSATLVSTMLSNLVTSVTNKRVIFTVLWVN
jgi:hypothetical protein